MGHAVGELDKIFSRFNRPGSAVKYTPDDRPPDPGELSPEPDDMRRVDFPCHPNEPVKVAEDWNESVHCLVCGETA